MSARVHQAASKAVGDPHRPSNGKKPIKITKIRTTALLCKFKQPYHWAQGVTLGAPVILIEVETDGGIIGIGESVASPTIETVLANIHDAIPHFIGNSI